MKARKAKDLRELNDVELKQSLREAEETLAKQRIQNALKQLQNTAYLRILKKDIARMKFILNSERNVTV